MRGGHHNTLPLRLHCALPVQMKQSGDIRDAGHQARQHKQYTKVQEMKLSSPRACILRLQCQSREAEAHCHFWRFLLLFVERKRILQHVQLHIKNRLGLPYISCRRYVALLLD